MTKWDVRFLELAKQIASWSKDPSTQVGCVVVGPDREIRSTGFNGLPRGIEDTEERLNNREMKYPLICHAEENAIMHAARIGIQGMYRIYYLAAMHQMCQIPDTGWNLPDSVS